MEREDLVFITLTLEELCLQLPGALPGGFLRELLVEAMAKAIADALAQAEGWSGMVQGLGARQEEARELGRRIAAMVPVMRARHADAPEDPPKPNFPPVDDAACESVALRAEQEAESAGEQAQYAFGDPHDETRRSTGETFGQPVDVFWSESFVKREAYRMLDFSRQIEAGKPPEQRPPLCVRFEQTTLAELNGGLDARRAYASRFGQGMQTMPRATRQQGTQVHNTLQQRYLDHVTRNRVVAEWRVYNVVLPLRLLRSATVTEMVHYEQNKLLLGITTVPDLTYLTLDLARLANKPGKAPDDVRTKYRWDLIDLDLKKIWEIKPVHSLEKAVNQEFFYRTKYNFWAFRIQYTPRRKKGRVKTEHISGGPAVALEGDDGSPFIPLKDGDTAVPFTLAALPGIIAYFILKTETEVEDLMRTLQKLMKDLEEAALYLVENWVLIVVLLAVLAIVVYLLLVLLSKSDPAPGNPDGTPRQLPAAGSGEAVKVPTGVGSVPVLLNFVDPQPQSVLRLSVTGLPASPEGAGSISFGKMTLDGLSAAQLGRLVQQVGTLGGTACANALRALKTGAGRTLRAGAGVPRV